MSIGAFSLKDKDPRLEPTFLSSSAMYFTNCFVYKNHTVQHGCTGSRSNQLNPPAGAERSTCGAVFQAFSWPWTLLPQEEGCTAKPESEPGGHSLHRQLAPRRCKRHQPHGPRPTAGCGHPADSTGSLRSVRVVHGPSGNRQHSVLVFQAQTRFQMLPIKCSRLVNRH